MEKARWVEISPSLNAGSDAFGEVEIEAVRPGCFRLGKNTVDIRTSKANLTLSVSGRPEVTLSGLFKEENNDWMFRVSEASLDTFHDIQSALRKEQHINLCQSRDVEHSRVSNGFEQFDFEPRTIPEFDLKDVSTKAQLFGRTFDYPFLVTGMTGGIAKASEINTRLAAVAEKFNVPMGVGSQRLALENHEYEGIFKLKERFPDLFLMGNIGMAQIQGKDCVETCVKACNMIEADALAIHLNLLQELVQVEGDRSFARTFENLKLILGELDVPVYVKEVGSGIDPSTARKLHELGVKTLDVGGAGGTSWTKIEGMRASDRLSKRLAESLSNFGKSTASSIKDIKDADLALELIATGGIRDGHDIAKSIAIGADFCGIGLPFFRAALESQAAVEDEFNFFAESLKIVMLATGSKTLESLSSALRYRGASQ